MRKIHIKSNDLVWNEWNSQHIKKHNVKKSEIEEALSQTVQARKENRGRLLIFGYTDTKRLLAIVIKKTNKGYYIFSARDASKKERKYI